MSANRTMHGPGSHGAWWARALPRWYARHQRTMPWRGHPDPYAVWVSEIMLQQTQVAAVVPYFERWMRAFPSVARLAAAPSQAVLKAWEGLGYYSRARNLHRAARGVVAERGGRLPRRAAEWEALPGVGPYTAAAIASIAYGEAVPVVDGNVMRVFARFRGLRGDVRTLAARAELAAFLVPHVPRRKPGDFNQAMMDLGATVCRPRRPDCAACPLAAGCVARAEGATDRIPLRRPRKKAPHYDVSACVIRRGDRVLIAQRRPDQMLGGMWEFPGGKRHAGETMAACAVREIEEELGMRIAVRGPICEVEHAYSHFSITLHALDCRVRSGRARPLECAAVRWVRPAQLREFPMPAADLRVLERLGW